MKCSSAGMAIQGALSMKAKLNRLPKTAVVEEVMEKIHADGYCIVEGLAGDQLMDKMAQEMDPWVEKTCYGKDEIMGMRTRRTGSLIARSTYARKLIMDPLVLGACGNMLSRASTFQINNAQILSVGPGAQGQPIHIDEHTWDFQEFSEPIMCNTIWAMSEFTEEIGATRIIPGSHNLPAGIHYEYEDTIPAEMNRGDVMIYSGKMYHGAGANTTKDRVRQGVSITYIVGWLRQEMNQFLDCPMEIARTLPDDLLKVMGYQLGSHGLGWWRDYEDPLAAVRSLPYEQFAYMDAVRRALDARQETQAMVYLSQGEQLAEQRNMQVEAS